jgi:hypothetical protein
MTRREILEKNWKEFRLSTGLKYEPMSDKAYEFMENAMEQYAELRLGGIVGQNGQLVCDHPDKAIIKHKPTDYCMACNRNI